VISIVDRRLFILFSLSGFITTKRVQSTKKTFKKVVKGKKNQLKIRPSHRKGQLSKAVSNVRAVLYF
jgi:hypothetical protein